MKRSDTFVSPTRRILEEHPTAKLIKDEVQGPISFFNPTSAVFNLASPEGKKASAAELSGDVPSSSDGTAPAALPSDVKVQWRTRDNRKGRHVLLIPKGMEKNQDYPDLTSTWKGIAKGIWRMVTVWAWWDVSWWIGILFSVGSALFIGSGLCYWLPQYSKTFAIPGLDTVDGGVLTFVGATLFQIGAIMLVIEACNENQTGCFGWALEQALSHDDPDASHAKIASKACSHHHTQGLHKTSALHLQHPSAGRRWEWWPTWHELTTHYFHEIGFLASFVLAVGATIFYISGILSLPGVYNHLPQGVLYGIYWLTYLVGGILFVISSALYMIETQPKWYLPAPKLLGWWIGVWNMVGSVGWTVSAAFGYCSASWCAYQSDLTLTWAAAGYTIGSLLLWYEALDKYPVERA